MGGVIALSFVLDYPDMVDKIIISDSFGELKSISERMLGFSQVIGFRLFKLLGNKSLAKGMESTNKADYAYSGFLRDRVSYITEFNGSFKLSKPR